MFEGPFGYLPLFEGTWDLAPIWLALGRTWRIAELSRKPYPSGRTTHAGIEGIAALRAAHGSTAAEVAHITVLGPPLIRRLCRRPAIPEPSSAYARLCTGFAIAKQLQHGTLDPVHYRGAARSQNFRPRPARDDLGGRQPGAYTTLAVSTLCVSS